MVTVVNVCFFIVLETLIFIITCKLYKLNPCYRVEYFNIIKKSKQIGQLNIERGHGSVNETALSYFIKNESVRIFSTLFS